MEFWLPLILIIVVVIVMVALGVVLRRRRAAASEEPPEIGSPTDYTSLPIEESTGWRERFSNLSLAGKALPIGKSRGPMEFVGFHGYVTVHPSYLLRVPDAESKRGAYQAFLRDLRRIHDLAAEEGPRRKRA